MKWSITIPDFNGGYAPKWYREQNLYPSYGQKNQAGAMSKVDLFNPGFLTQGPGLRTLTNGNQTGEVTTLIKGMFDFGISPLATPFIQNSYGIGGNLLYQFNNSGTADVGTVTSSATWPHTIDKAAVTGEDGDDVIIFQNNLYYSYDHSGSAGDIGKYNLDATFDDDWGSTVPTGAATLTYGVPHPMAVGGNGTFAIGNGRYLAIYDGATNTLDVQALDLPVGYIIVDVQWLNDRWWISANYLNNSSVKIKILGSIFVWDGTTEQFEAEFKVGGRCGASFIKNATFYQFYDDTTDVPGGTFGNNGATVIGYFDGSDIVEVIRAWPGLPEFYQVTEYKSAILWVNTSDDDIHALVVGDKNNPSKVFDLAAGAGVRTGGIACPFGNLLIASSNLDATVTQIDAFKTYAAGGNWKSLLFDITADEDSKIDCVRINFEKLTTGARVDWSLVNNQGKTIFSDTISFSKLGAVTSVKTPLNGLVAENLRLQFDFTNASTTNPVRLKNAKIYGHTG